MSDRMPIETMALKVCVDGCDDSTCIETAACPGWTLNASPPAKAPTMDAIEAVTDAQALAALRDEMVAAIRDIRAEKGFAGGTEYFGGDDLSQWEREVIADRLLSIVTREANFAGDRALAAARPFIAAECAKVARAAFDDRPRTRDSYHYQDGYDDGTKAAETAIKETIR